ncbi:MAG TPA: hypothetical protein VKF81_05830, partial [Blastocatellia bacterium]|nr:hypothetical protein [Blastocatellia bacterium]
MRIATEFLAVLLMVIGPGSPDDKTPRGLFINKTADAVEVRIIDDRTGLAVFPNQEFKQDDSLRIEIKTNFEAYVYIVNLEIANEKTNSFLVFPTLAAPDHKLRADATARLSATFDQNSAAEILQVIASHDPLDLLESVLKGPNCSREERRCQLDRVTADRLTQMLGERKSSSGQKEAAISAMTGGRQKGNSIRTRDIILSPGKDKNDKSTYVAVQNEDGTEGKLKSGQIVGFEIRLKH